MLKYDVVTDTRRINGGEIFIALKGPNFNANNFVRQADLLSASVIIIDEIFEIDDDFIKNGCKAVVILVSDCVKAYGQLANFYRNQELQYSKIIGITGSIGKTTTKNILSFVLGDLLKTIFSSEANLNNQIGVPQSLFQADEKSQLVILEMAMRRAGEIKFLSSVAEPDIAVVTNVSTAHLEFFDDIQGIARAKAEIFQHMKSDGWAILNRSCDQFNILLEFVTKRTKNILTYSIDSGFSADVTLVKYETNFDNTVSLEIFIKDFGNLSYKLPLSVRSLIENSLIVFGVSRILNINLYDVAKTISNFPLNNLSGRGNYLSKKLKSGGDVTIIDESYNAAFEAMKTALYNLGSLPFHNFNIKRRVAFIGEMRELGKNSLELHLQLLNCLKGIDKIATIGGVDMLSLNEKIILTKNLGHFNNVDDLISHLENIVLEGDLILLKGAKSNEMHKVICCFD